MELSTVSDDTDNPVQCGLGSHETFSVPGDKRLPTYGSVSCSDSVRAPGHSANYGITSEKLKTLENTLGNSKNYENSLEKSTHEDTRHVGSRSCKDISEKSKVNETISLGSTNFAGVVSDKASLLPDDLELCETDGQQIGGKTLSVALLCVAYIVCFVAVRVVLPIFTGSTKIAGSDSYQVLLFVSLTLPIVLAVFSILYKACWDREMALVPSVRWWVLLQMGVCFMLTGLCATFASPPSRTPPYLQGVLLTLIIPFTVVARFVILRKGKFY